MVCKRNMINTTTLWILILYKLFLYVDGQEIGFHPKSKEHSFCLEGVNNDNVVYESFYEPNIFILSMAGFERDVWLHKLNLTIPVHVPGLSLSFPDVYCNSNYTICQMTTGEGLINTASSTTALFLNSKFNLKSTYFIIAGVGGGNPNVVTRGSATIARFAIQIDLQYEIDSRDKPESGVRFLVVGNF